MQLTRARLIALFMVLCAVGSWLPVAWLWSRGLAWTSGEGRALGFWSAIWVLIVTLLIQGPILKQPVAKPLGLSFSINRWWLVAWLLPVFVLAVSLVLLAALGYDPVVTTEQLVQNKRSFVPPEQLADFEKYLLENPHPSPLRLVLMGLPAGLTFNLLPAFAEEIGFRGFLFREMPGRFWTRSMGIAFLWWIWLLPSVLLGNFYPEQPASGPVLALLWCAVVTPVLVYLRVRSESLIAVAIARGTMVALTSAAIDLSFGAPYTLRPFYGAAGIGGLAVVLVLFLVHDKFFAERRLVFVGTSDATPEPSEPPASNTAPESSS